VKDFTEEIKGGFKEEEEEEEVRGMARNG